MPEISIIVPVYNVAPYLEGCLDSLLAQTLREIEIICVDDGSTDHSPEIVREYARKDERIRYIRKENGGLSSARNAGLAAAQAEFVTFVDSDDYVEPETYEKALAAMGDDIDYVCFGIQTYGDVTEEIRESDEKYYAIKYQGKVKITTEVLELTDVSSCNKVFRKSLMERYRISYPEGLKFEDAYFFNIYALRSKYAFYIQDKLYHYIRRKGSIMGSTLSERCGQSIDYVRIGIKIYEYLKENGLLIKYMRYVGTLLYSFIGFAFRYEHTPEGQRAIYDLCQQFMEKEGVTWSEYADIQPMYEDLRLRRWGIKWDRTFWGGLIVEKRTYSRIKYYFCGIPLLRIKIRGNIKKYYLFSMFYIKKERVHYSPRVSVVMPAYQAEKYISTAIDSIICQSFTDFELIIINDGSTDATQSVVESYDDPRIILINNSENQGLVAALNSGIECARGEYIARMDADDISVRDRLAKQVRFLDTHPKVGIVGSWFYIFGNKGFHRIEQKPASPTLRDLVETSPLGHPTVMMRQDTLQQYDLSYDARYKHAEDYELWRRALRYTKLANIQEVLLNYRVTENSVSMSYASEQARISEVVRQKARRCLGDASSLIQMHLDDSSIIEALGWLGPFSYMPNSGNMGDALIAAATIQWLEKHQFNWHRAQENEYPENFVYGGGGAWLHSWIDALQPVMEKMRRAKRIVILPSSFHDVPELIEILDERFIVFCREQRSYDYLVSQHTRATIRMGHDMALYISDLPTVAAPPTKQLQQAYLALMQKINALPTECVELFRQDGEAALSRATQLDISDALGWFSPWEPKEHYNYAARTILDALRRFELVCTDRLHVGISAALVGTDVRLYDNSYGKVSGVYKHSLSCLPHVNFVSNTPGENP